MTRQRRFQDNRTGQNGSSKGKEQLSAAQLELNRLKKKIASLNENISIIPDKEERIKDFFDRNAKPIFEKETAMKYKYLVYLDESYEGGELTEDEKDTLINLFAEESQGVDDYITDDEQRKHLKEMIYKYDGLSLGLEPEQLELESAEDTLNLFVDLYGVRPNKAMKEAKSGDEVLVAVSDYIEAKAAKEAAIAAGEKPKRASRKAKGGEIRRVIKRELIDQIEMMRTLDSLKDIYLILVDERFKDKADDAEAMALKEECLKELAEAKAAKDLADILLMQVEWIEDDIEEAPVGDDTALADFNTHINKLLSLIDQQMEVLNDAPLPGVESPYNRLRHIAWKNLPIQMNLLFTHQKKNIKTIEDYMKSVSKISGLKIFLSQFRQNYDEGNIFEDDWFTE